MLAKDQIAALKKLVEKLEKENLALRKLKNPFFAEKATVSAPAAILPIFEKANKVVGEYFKGFKANPATAQIEIADQRYILMRAPSLSNDFFKNLIKLYADRGEEEAVKIGRNLLFDMAHLIGIEDAKNFHQKMKLKDPLSKLSAGPVHFAYTGWAYVDILPESCPSPDENYYLKYNHPFSFEADSWIKAKEKTKIPVCSMNAGYSSGWCQESYGIELTAVEITCRAKGDKECTFIMAPPSKINQYLKKEEAKYKGKIKYDVPLFFERKKVEEKLNSSLKEKEILIKEIHHRVKNNLQIISSLLKLQTENSKDVKFLEMVSDARNRILSMSLIHEMLYSHSDFSRINLQEYLKLLTDKLKSSFDGQISKIDFKLSIDKNQFFEIDRMIPIGLILNEIISNAFKYAFPNKKGLISIIYKNNELSVNDSGIGFPPKFDLKKHANFGVQLIFLLAEQLNCKAELKLEKGAYYNFKF